jgi:Mn-dependent DtxR family transcriptional regulator
MWKVSQPAVSQALGFLMRYGYVMSIPRRGLTPTQYVLTGASRLIFPVA